MDLWVFGATANGIVMAAYLAIAYHVFKGIAATNQWRVNPLAVATGFIFFSCGVGHGIHFAHTLLPFVGISEGLGFASRQVYNDWHMWAWDASTAMVAVWYLSLRSRFPALVKGASMYEDLRQRQRQALEIHDNVVQGLAKAKLAFDLGLQEEGKRELTSTLDASRRIITDLLGERDGTSGLGPGDLRRVAPASEAPVKGGGLE